MTSPTQQSIDVSQLIDSRPVGPLQIRVVVLCGLVSLLDGFDIQVMALVVPALSADWALPSRAFGTALAAVLLGIACGAGVGGPLGDRRGRKPTLVIAMLVAGLASLGTATASSVEQLAVWRLLTGIGLGASIPNAIALTAEYLPTRRRAALVTLMYCNISVGAFLAGFTAPSLIAAFGWSAVFVVAGLLPLVVALGLAIALPESLRYLLACRPDDSRIAVLTSTLAPDKPGLALAAPALSRTRSSTIAEILAPPYTRITLLLWATFALNLFVLYLLVSWLPTMLTDAGWSRQAALRGAVLVQLGGIAGGLLLAWFVDRGRAASSLAAGYAITAGGLMMFIVLPADPATWSALLVLIGGGTVGAQFALNALAASYYPVHARATGVGWALGVGRAGAIASPFVGAALVAADMPAEQILLLAACPVVICAACVVALQREARRRNDARRECPPPNSAD